MHAPHSVVIVLIYQFNGLVLPATLYILVRLSNIFLCSFCMYTNTSKFMWMLVIKYKLNGSIVKWQQLAHFLSTMVDVKSGLSVPSL